MFLSIYCEYFIIVFLYRNKLLLILCSSSSSLLFIHSPIIVQLPSPMGGGGSSVITLYYMDHTAWDTNSLPYTTHAPIAIQGSRIKMSDMNHEGQILHIGYRHHTGVTNNIRGHASVYTGYEHFAILGCHEQLPISHYKHS